MAYVTADALKADVIAWRQMNGLPTPADANWTTVCTKAAEWGANEVKAALVSQGYTAAQAEAWDRSNEFSTSMGMFWALTMGMVGQAYDRAAIDEFDRREELKAAVLLIDGEIPELPEEEASARGVAFGMLSNKNDVFSMDDPV